MSAHNPARTVLKMEELHFTMDSDGGGWYDDLPLPVMVSQAFVSTVGEEIMKNMISMGVDITVSYVHLHEWCSLASLSPVNQAKIRKMMEATVLNQVRAALRRYRTTCEMTSHETGPDTFTIRMLFQVDRPATP
jgi:hypothetical protein